MRLLILVVVAMGATSGQVLWRGDFETGDLRQWSWTLNPTTGERPNIEIVPSTLTGQAARLTIHPDDVFANGHNRVELQYAGGRTAEGQTTYFSWWFRLETDARIHDDIAYWETKGPSYRQSMAFFVDPSPQGTNLSFRTNLPSPRQHSVGPITASVWHQLAMKIQWSQDPHVGRVSVWLDCREVVAEAPAQTKPDATDLFIQMGFHRDRSADVVETMYIDSALEGSELHDLFPVGSGCSQKELGYR